MATTQQSTSRTSTSKQQTKAPKTASSKTSKKPTKSQPTDKKTSVTNPHSSNKDTPAVKQTSDASSPPNKTESIKPADAISDELRLSMIAEAAYYRAAKRGFDGSNEEEDWLVAEAEIDAVINEGKLAALN